MEKYLSVLDADIKINQFWKENPSNKSEFKRQLYGNGKCDLLGKMLSDSLNINIILIDCGINEIKFVGDSIYKDNQRILLIVKKYMRYFPIISLDGSLYDIKEDEIQLIFEDIKMIEKVYSDTSSSDDTEEYM